MTVVGGNIVHAQDEFASLNPPLPPISPDWSPVKYYGTYGQNKIITQNITHSFNCNAHSQFHTHFHNHYHDHYPGISGNPQNSPFHFGCLCWAI